MVSYFAKSNIYSHFHLIFGFRTWFALVVSTRWNYISNCRNAINRLTIFLSFQCVFYSNLLISIEYLRNRNNPEWHWDNRLFLGQYFQSSRLNNSKFWVVDWLWPNFFQLNFLNFRTNLPNLLTFLTHADESSRTVHVVQVLEIKKTVMKIDKHCFYRSIPKRQFFYEKSNWNMKKQCFCIILSSAVCMKYVIQCVALSFTLVPITTHLMHRYERYKIHTHCCMCLLCLCVHVHRLRTSFSGLSSA